MSENIIRSQFPAPSFIETQEDEYYDYEEVSNSSDVITNFEFWTNEFKLAKICIMISFSTGKLRQKRRTVLYK